LKVFKLKADVIKYWLRGIKSILDLCLIA